MAWDLAPEVLFLNLHILLKLFSAMFAAEASSHTPLCSIITADACLTKTDYLALINIVFHCMPV